MPELPLSQAELLNGLFSALQTILSIVSLFFAIVSGYIAALYFFLARAGLFLRALAFALLTIGMSFLGGTAAVVGSMSPLLDAGSPRPPLDASALGIHGTAWPSSSPHAANTTIATTFRTPTLARSVATSRGANALVHGSAQSS